MGWALATFNVRDFFDDEAPQVIADLDRGEYTPERRERARGLLARKVESVADTLARLDADVVCLQEVKNERVCRLVLEKLEGRIAGYPTVVVGGGEDIRGIRTAVLARFPLAAEPVRHTRDSGAEGFCLPRVADGDPDPAVHHFKRGLLEVPLTLPDGERLTLFNVHLKSGYSIHPRPPGSQTEVAEGFVRASMLRTAEALQVRRLVDQRIAERPQALVAVAGDFNEGPDSLLLRAVTGDLVEEIRRGIPGALYTVTGGIPLDRRFSIVYRGRREQLDHVLVTKSLWSRFREARILNEAHYDPDAYLRERSREGPDSDHAPVLATFR
jgi:predicted extracellular nuclease